MTETGAAPIDAARIVNERYRLHAADLHGRAVHAHIVNVSFQGVEELQVVLHVSGFLKPLVLTSAQRQALLQLMHGRVLEQWIAQPITLRPRRVDGVDTIEIAAMDSGKIALAFFKGSAPTSMQRVYNMLANRSTASATMNSYAVGLLILLVLSLLFGLAYLIDNPELWRAFLGQ